MIDSHKSQKKDMKQHGALQRKYSISLAAKKLPETALLENQEILKEVFLSLKRMKFYQKPKILSCF
jgi:formylmethanofuran dehydrogenase subunit B